MPTDKVRAISTQVHCLIMLMHINRPYMIIVQKLFAEGDWGGELSNSRYEKSYAKSV